MSQALRNSPPGVSESIGCAAALPLIAMPVLAMAGAPLVPILVLGFGGAIALAVWAYKAQRPQIESETAKYQRQWYCFKCGNIFHAAHGARDQSPNQVEFDESTEAPSGRRASEDLRPISSPDRDEYIERILRLRQRTTQPTDRDLRGLAEVQRRADHETLVFDPTGMDKGIISRLASLSYVAYDEKADAIVLTALGDARTRSANGVE